MRKYYIREYCIAYKVANIRKWKQNTLMPAIHDKVLPRNKLAIRYAVTSLYDFITEPIYFHNNGRNVQGVSHIETEYITVWPHYWTNLLP